LHHPVSPIPLTLRSKSHIGLDLYPIGPSSQNRRGGQVYRERRSDYRDRLIERAENLSARKSTAVGVNENIPIGGRSRALEVSPVRINRLHIPSLPCRHNKIVSQIGAKGGEVGERCRPRVVGGSVIVLIIENYLRKVRVWQNPERANADSATGGGGKLLRLLALGNFLHRLVGNCSISTLRHLPHVLVGSRIYLGSRIDYASLDSFSLPQRERNRADGDKCKQDQRAPKQVRLN